MAFEARKESPVPANIQYAEFDAETSTQRIKIMYLLCMTSTTPIGAYELDFRTYNAKYSVKTKQGKDAVAGGHHCAVPQADP